MGISLVTELKENLEEHPSIIKKRNIKRGNLI